MYIIIAILAFGILIGIHEFGHFIVAKAFRVRVNEFSIGMGPALLKKQGKETLYSLRLLPIGGYCAMEGEDESSADPRAFTSQPIPKRLAVLAAGPVMNFAAGFLVIVIMFAGAAGFGSNVIAELADGFPNAGEDGLMPGDRIVSLNGERVWYSTDFSSFMNLDGDGFVDLALIRDGRRVEYSRFPLAPREYANPDGTVSVRYGLSFQVLPASPLTNFKYSCYQAYNFVRLIRISLADLIRGAVGIKDLSGPVGIVSTINDVAKEAPTRAAAFQNVAYLCAFVAVNLAVMNLLPIPALDGGRIFLMLVTGVIQLFSRKRVDPKYEGYIHTAGLVLLLGLMAFVMVNDVLKVIHG